MTSSPHFDPKTTLNIIIMLIIRCSIQQLAFINNDETHTVILR